MNAQPAPVSEILSRKRTILARAVMYFGFWVVLMPRFTFDDLAVGAFAAAAATWASMRLLPPAAGRLRFNILLALMPHFLWESVLAGFDDACRVFSPKMPLNPGFVTCPLAFPPGMARNTFATISSLLPGSVPAGDGDDILIFHCIDVSQPVVEKLSDEERLFAKALIKGDRHV